MRITLARHYTVDFRFQRFGNAAAFNCDMGAYDEAGILFPVPARHRRDWTACFTSTLNRAIETGRHLFDGPIRSTPLIDEVPMRAFCATNIPLPLFVWAVAARLQWYFQSRRQIEIRRDTIRRAEAFYTRFCVTQPAPSRLLVVSHAFFLYVFRKVLHARGFQGPRFLKMKNGQMIDYEGPVGLGENKSERRPRR